MIKTKRQTAAERMPTWYFELGLTEVRIFAVEADGKLDQYKTIISPIVPRVGDHMCIQDITAPIFKVEWTILSDKLVADVFCDTSEDDADHINL